MAPINSKTIVFIHGAFVAKNCWDEWKKYFEKKGYKVLAPAWPHKDATAKVLRSRQSDAAVASLRLTELTEFYVDFVKKLPEKPILIGHSLGGLLVQLLLQRDLGAAGVGIHSLPPQGVITLKFSFLRAGWGPLGFFTSTKETFLMSLKQWQFAFTNGMPLNQQKKAYEQLAVPESKLLVRDGITSAAKVDFKKPHASLLLTSGSEDNFLPASLNYSNYKRYKDPDSVTDYKEFEGRNHFVLGQPTWKEDADYILNWISQH